MIGAGACWQSGRWTAIGAAAAVSLWLGLAAAPASAATFCVQLPQCPQNGPNYATLQEALDAADANDGYDNIQIGPVTLHHTHAVDVEGNPVSIFGRGQTQTVLVPDGEVAPNQLGTALYLFDPNSSVQELGIRLTFVNVNLGLGLLDATARHVRITSEPQVEHVTHGVFCFGDSAFRQGSVTVPLTPQDEAINAGDGCLVQDSTLTGYFGMNVRGGPATVRRTKITATHGIHAHDGAVVNAEDVLILPRPATIADSPELQPTGLEADASAAGSGIVARHATIFGTGAAGTTGVRVDADPDSAAQSATIQLADSIVRNFAVHLWRNAGPAAHDSTFLYVDYSDYDRSRVRDAAPGSAGAFDQLPHNVNNIVPGFVSPGSDFHLRPDSPLIDMGDPAGRRAGESQTDLDGNRRILDGDGDGVARRDMGAYEAPQPNLPPMHVIKGTGKGDQLQGSKSADVIRTGEGDDSAFGGKGADWLFGAKGLDKLFGGAGPDRLFGGADGDELDGGRGPDRLFGGLGPDRLVGGLGPDTFRAGAGDDTILARDGIAEIVDCGPGKDHGEADANDTLLDCEAIKQPSAAF